MVVMVMVVVVGVVIGGGGWGGGGGGGGSEGSEHRTGEVGVVSGGCVRGVSGDGAGEGGVEGGELSGGGEAHGGEVRVRGPAGGRRGTQGRVWVVNHVLRFVGHGHVAGVETAVGDKGGVGRVLGGLHLHLCLLRLTLELHSPVLEPGLHLNKTRGTLCHIDVFTVTRNSCAE